MIRLDLGIFGELYIVITLAVSLSQILRGPWWSTYDQTVTPLVVWIVD